MNLQSISISDGCSALPWPDPERKIIHSKGSTLIPYLKIYSRNEKNKK